MAGTNDEAKIEKIRKYIMKSGFPAEIEIGNILRKNYWIVVNQLPYTDATTGKLRTIDVSAFKPSPIPKMGGFQIFVECKKSDKHDWVFHTQHKTAEFLPATLTVIELFKTIGHPAVRDKVTEIAKEYTIGDFLSRRASESIGSLVKLHNFDEAIRLGIMHVIPDNNDDFLEAKQQIMSAMKGIDKTKNTFIKFPVIVFDGEIYEFYQVNEEMKVLPTNHLQFVLYDGDMLACTIDIVRKSYFQEFVKILENDIAIYTTFCSDNKK